jgi:hypothetical protein
VAAQLDAEVTVIDRDGLAGSAVLTDCVPSKTLIATAELMTSIEESRELGVGSAHQNLDPVASVHRAKINARVKRCSLRRSATVDAYRAPRRRPHPDVGTGPRPFRAAGQIDHDPVGQKAVDRGDIDARSIMLPLAGNSRAKMRVSTMVRQGVLPARYGDCRRQRCRRERELIHLIAGGRRRSRPGVHGQSVVSGSVVLSPVERLRP